MKSNISTVIAAYQDENIIDDALKSVTWTDEIIVIFANNTVDKSPEIAKLYTKKIYYSPNDLGQQRNVGIYQAISKWILILDTDERVSNGLKNELLKISASENNIQNGYYIPFENHFLNRRLKWGNQNYSKKRFFKKEKGHVEFSKIHPEIIIENPVGKLRNSIIHYSFRSLGQTLEKFTYYASVEAEELFKIGERVNLKKLTLYPLHMFWAIFVKDEGYRDGVWGLGLALCFTYYEFAKYFLLLVKQLK